jgi:hypothetical protein
VNDPEITSHENPAWRDRANYILQADLTDHGMPGLFEQLWARDLGGGRFELCCLPFFTYRYALGDVAVLQHGSDRFPEVLGPVVTGSGRGLLRIALSGRTERREDLHAAVAASGRPHEWRGGGLVAIDIEGAVPDVIWQAIEGLRAREHAEWEWGSTRPTG